MSMSAKVGINGFNKIARMIFSQLLEQPEVEVTHINDSMDISLMAYLLKYDTRLGSWNLNVEIDDTRLIVNDKSIEITHFQHIEEIPWEQSEVEYVIETTASNTYSQLVPHLRGSVKKVILAGLPGDNSIQQTIVMGVNQMMLQEEDKISASACGTTQCISLMLKVLNDEFGIVHGFMHNIQPKAAMPTSQLDYRCHHSVGENVIPIPADAVRGVQFVLPDLKNIFDGMTTYVPADAGFVELTAELRSDVTTRVVKDAFQCYANGPLQEYLEYCDRPIVSNNLIGNPHSAIFDVMSTKVIDNRLIQILCWYDCEYIHSLRIIDLLKYIHEL